MATTPSERRPNHGLPRMARWLKQALRGVGIAVCKAALLVTMLSISIETETKASEAESESTVETEWLHQCEGSRRDADPTPNRISHRWLINRGWFVAARRATSAPQSSGHRLANGLLAPLTC